MTQLTSETKRPAMVALIRFDKVAAVSARRPYRPTRPRMSGLIAPKLPVKIAIEEKLANPHNANETIANVLGVKICSPLAAT